MLTPLIRRIALLCAFLPAGVFGQLSSQWTALNRAGDYGNGEAQCYVPANATVGGGNLSILTKVQSQVCGDATHSPSTFNYTSEMVQWSSFKFTYGTVEVRAKVSGGQGSWPAIWLLGSDCQTSNVTSADNIGTCNWPNPGSEEIDIAEFSNYSFDHFSSVSHHLFRSTGNGSCSQNMPNGADASQAFHVYTMTWTSSSITFAIDGVAANCGGDAAYTSNIPSSPMFLMINNAMGGGGGTIVNSNYPQTMLVDYVKVTQGGNVTFFDDFTGTPTATCDLNGDGVVNSTDIQLAVDQALGRTTCGAADLDQNGACNVIDVQRVVNASLGQACRIGP